jgi:hypothetical protein
MEVMPSVPAQRRWLGVGLMFIWLLVSADQPRRADAMLTRMIPISTTEHRAVPLPAVPPPKARQVHTSTAALESPTPTTAQGKGTLIIQARPWGLVSIPDVVRKREAPLALQLQAGEYAIRVQQGDRQTSVRAEVVSGQKTRCRASFGDRAKAWCQKLQ